MIDPDSPFADRETRIPMTRTRLIHGIGRVDFAVRRTVKED